MKEKTGSYKHLYMSKPRRAEATRPPSTPPTIAPTGVCLGSAIPPTMGTAVSVVVVSEVSVVVVERVKAVSSVVVVGTVRADVCVVVVVIYDVIGGATAGRELTEHEVE